MADQADKIAQLQMIANTPEDLSREVLENNGWDVAKSLDILLGGGGGGGGGGLGYGLGGLSAGPDVGALDAADQHAAAAAAAEAIAAAEVARASLNDADPTELDAAVTDAEHALIRAREIDGAMPIHAQMERMLSLQGRGSAMHQTTIPFAVSFLGNEVLVDMSVDDTVRQLKLCLMDRTGVPIDKQMLLGWRDGEPSHMGCVLGTLVHLPTTEPVRLMLWVEDGINARADGAGNTTANAPALARPAHAHAHARTTTTTAPSNRPSNAGAADRPRAAATTPDRGMPPAAPVSPSAAAPASFAPYTRSSDGPALMPPLLETAAAAAVDADFVLPPLVPRGDVSPRSASVSVEGVTDDSDDDPIGGDDGDFDDDFFDDDDDTHGATASSGPAPMVPSACMDPFELANHFADSFIRRYKREGREVPNFFRAPLSEALREAEATAKPLLLYLHSDHSAETNVFCSESLATGMVAEFINQNFVLWGVDITLTHQRLRFEHTPYGQQVLPFLESLSKCPALYALVKLPGRIEKHGSVIGFEDSETLFAKLLQIREACEGALQEVHREATRRNEAEALRQQQEFEFEESLRRDREKQRAKEEADAIEASRLAEVERQQQAEAQREQLAAERVPAEPDASDKSAIKLQFRLPGGGRCERRFNATDTVGHVLHYLHSEGRPATKFATFHIPRPGQKIKINDSDPSTLLGDFGLHKRDLLYVEDIE
eukprot:m.125926 g.125926  ORF g.125926 m.125926 type:complete len:716 (+) comp11177_c0_seq1:279-2426(+)